MRVCIRGKTYPDVKAAAADLGVATATVYCGIIRGNVDRIGLGPDYEARNHSGGRPPKPVIIGGQRFASMADLAKAIGREPRNVRASLRRGPEAHRRLAIAVMRAAAARENAALRKRLKQSASIEPRP